MKRERPKKIKGEVKQVHFDMDLNEFLEFEKVVYNNGSSVSDFFRKKAKEEIKKYIEGRVLCEISKQ